MHVRRLAVVCALALSVACGGRTPAASEVSVVAAFYPLYEAAGRIAGDTATVTNLTPPGVEPHDLELAPDTLEAIIDADLVLYIGRGFQPAVEDAISRTKGDAVDVLDGLDLVDAPEGGTDPHVWLDPKRFTTIVSKIEHALTKAAPGDAETLRQNGDAYRAGLGELDRALAAGLRDCRRRLVVTSHAAFGYLTSRYDLVQHSITGISPEAEPTAARLAELTDLVKKNGVTTIFTEELASPKVAATLAREAGVNTDVLSPIESAGEGETYASIMRENLEVLRAALECS